ncbi:MAG: sporulation protein YqfD [Eubacterium sp.]|nr:sporulation protein YqfD [Eubacterium sp.]
MKNLIRLCKGIVRIRVTGYSPERFLNLCKGNQIPLYHITDTTTGYEMEIAVKDVFLLKKLLKKTGTKLQILHKKGLPFVLFRYRRHKCFLVGIGLALLCLLLMSQFLWEIEIKGNYQITDEQFLTYLESQNISNGVWISNVDCEWLEEQIRNDYPDIAWVSARIEGTRLIFDIQELKTGKDSEAITSKEGSDEQESLPQQSTDLIASQDGIIRSIVTRNGTPLVKAGDEVKKGDVLISGCNELFDDYGTVTGYEYCQAEGDIWIVFEETYQDSIAVAYEKKNFTDKKRAAIRIAFPEKTLTMGRTKHIFEHYQIFTENKQLKIGKRIVFPIYIQTQSIQEIVLENAIHTEEEIQQIAKDHFALYSKKMEKKGFQILDKDGKIKVNEKQVLVTGTIQFTYLETERGTTPVRTLDVEEGLEQNGIDADTNGDSS